jgi:uncharacterized protein involved in outer membrane biogenesis
MSYIPRSRASRWLLGALGVFVALIAGALIALALFDWNHARGWIAEKVKERSGRDLVIGDLDVRPFSLHPRVQARDVRLSNTEWGDETPMIEADSVEFSIGLLSLLRGRVVFPEVTLGEASVLMQRDGEGRRNWVLNREEEKTGEPVQIGRLTVNKGRLAFKDAITDSNLTLGIQTIPDDKYGVEIAAQGKAKGYRFKAAGRGGGLLSLVDQSQAYPVELNADIGEAHATFDGTITGLAGLEEIDGRFTLAGRNLSTLGDAIRLAFPDTRPYKIGGRLVRSGEVWRYDEFRGTVGESDLRGNFKVDMEPQRPMMEAKLHSNLLDIADLGGFVGGKPGQTDRTEPGKVLPAETISVEKLRRMDANVTLAASKFRNRDKLPLDNLNARLTLADGLLKFDPVDFGVAGGKMANRAAVDARAQPVVVDLDSRFQKLHLGQLVPGAKVVEESVGALDGRLQLKGTGTSMAAVLGSANGRVDLVSGGGEVSNLLLEFGGADIGEIIGFLVGGDRKVELRCAAMAFSAKDGIMSSEAIVIDTDDTYFGGKGSVNLKDETLDLTVTPLPKDMSILALRGPLKVTGTFEDPKVGLEKAALARRIGAGILLGLIHPLASLLATVETAPGRRVKAPCVDLVQSLQANVQGVPAAREKEGTASVSKGERQRLSERQEPATQKEAPGDPVTMKKGEAAAGKRRPGSRDAGASAEG